MPPGTSSANKTGEITLFFLHKIISRSWFFPARAFYLALIWVYRVLTIFLWSPVHLMPLLAPVQSGTVKGRFSSIVTAALSFLLCFSRFFFDSWVATKPLVLAGQNLASFPLVVKPLSYDSERGENLCVKQSPQTFQLLPPNTERIIFLIHSFIRQILIVSCVRGTLPGLRNRATSKKKTLSFMKHIFKRRHIKMEQTYSRIISESEKDCEGNEKRVMLCRTPGVGKCYFWAISQGRPLRGCRWSWEHEW